MGWAFILPASAGRPADGLVHVVLTRIAITSAPHLTPLKSHAYQGRAWSLPRTGPSSPPGISPSSAPPPEPGLPQRLQPGRTGLPFTTQLWV